MTCQKPICGPGGSPARTSATPESAWEFEGKDRDCSSTLCDWPLKYDPDTSSWRTSAPLLTGDYPRYSGRWPKAGMMRNGIVCPRSRLVLRIRGREYLLLPTPVSAERRSYQRDNGQKGKERLTLLGLARLHHYGILATPNAGDFKAGYSNAENRGQKSLPRDVVRLLGLISGKRGRLNPTKLGWMMGFPPEMRKSIRDCTETP